MGGRKLLSGIGAILFQPNERTGLILLATVTASAPGHALGAVLGMAGSIGAVGALDRETRESVPLELILLNAFLAGIGVVFFLPSRLFAWILAFVAGATVPWSAMLLHRLLRRRELPLLTSPFIMILWVFWLVLLAAQALPYASAPATALRSSSLALSPALLLEAAFRGLGQAVFQDSAAVGAAIAFALLISSWRAALHAVLGSLGGTLVALALHADPEQALHGLYGFNAAFCSLYWHAMGLERTEGRRLAAALVAAMGSAVFMVAMLALLGPINLPPMTAPYLVVVWLTLILRRRAPAVS